MLFSSTKSVLSALVGIALEEGAIESLEQKVASWFPDYEELNPSPEKSEITLEDLLTMRSGLEFTEGEQETFQAPDPARAMLARDVVDTPVGTIRISRRLAGPTRPVRPSRSRGRLKLPTAGGRARAGRPT